MPEPGILAVYGEIKRGKTVDTVAAFPTALFIAAPTALDSARAVLGIEPSRTFYPTLDQIIVSAEAWRLDGTLAKFGGLAIDDGSLTLEDSMVGWRAEPGAGSNRYHAFNRLDTGLSQLRLLGRQADRYVAINFHERPPKKTDSGILVTKGCALVPSINQGDAIPAAAKCVLRVVHDPKSLDPWWPFCYDGNPTDPEWSMGDRHDVLTRLQPRGPMNLRELLREGGVELPRWPGLEWQDPWAEHVADALDKGVPLREVAEKVASDLAALDWRHVRWAVRDGIARHVYRTRRRSWLDALDMRPPVSMTTGAPPSGGKAIGAPPK